MGYEHVSDRGETLLELRGVTQRYANGTDVLCDCSLEVNRGELVCILGPSGCGKTTLLKVAGSFLIPDHGIVLLKDRPVSQPDPDRVMVFQDQDQLFPWIRVRENVLFGLTGRESARVRDRSSRLAGARVDRALAEVGLTDAARCYPYQLSGGMCQRVALARALVGRPELLLMDEPFGSVDAPQRGELQRLLQRLLADHDGTAVFVTHDVEEALVLGTRIVVMNRDGSIVLSEDRTRAAGDDNDGSRRERLLAALHREFTEDRADILPRDADRVP